MEDGPTCWEPGSGGTGLCEEVGGLLWRADSDSANLHRVECTSKDTFQLYIAPDCRGTKFENQYRMWYMFCVAHAHPGRTIRMNIMDLNEVAKVYQQDLRPLVRLHSAAAWERLLQPATFRIEASTASITLSFSYTFVSSEPVYFAFYYPFPYRDCQALLDCMDRRLRRVAGSDVNGGKRRSPADPGAVYYHRELLTTSVQGRRVELLTITSRAGMLNDREPPIEGLFPEHGLRPRRFKAKAGVFVSARVHPGETASSYMFHGLLEFLLGDDPVAVALRDAFVFKMVPMLNPDGVVMGNFRADCFGVNLNRAYSNAHPARQPSVFAVRMLLKQMMVVHTPLPGSKTGLWFYMDLHSFSARRGVYSMGNAMAPHLEAQSLAFTHLAQLHSPQFSVAACSFGRGRKNRSTGVTPADVTSAAVFAAVNGAPLGPPVPPVAAGAPSRPFVDVSHVAATHRAASSAASGAAVATVVLPAGGSLHPVQLTDGVDPYAGVECVLPGIGSGVAHATLSDGEQSRLLKDWTAFKARTAGKTEGQKDGTGRVAAYRLTGAFHSYTIECSCNLLSHTQVFMFNALAAHPNPPSGPRRAGSGDGTPAVGGADDPPVSMTALRRVRLECPRGGCPPLSQVLGLGRSGEAPAPLPPSGCPLWMPAREELDVGAAGFLAQVNSLVPPSSVEAAMEKPPADGDTLVCEWGTCPMDPPAVFAAAGQAAAAAWLRLAAIGGGAGRRLARSQWRTVDGLHKWARAVVGVPYVPAKPPVRRPTGGRTPTFSGPAILNMTPAKGLGKAGAGTRRPVAPRQPLARVPSAKAPTPRRPVDTDSRRLKVGAAAASGGSRPTGPKLVMRAGVVYTAHDMKPCPAPSRAAPPLKPTRRWSGAPAHTAPKLDGVVGSGRQPLRAVKGGRRLP